MNTPETHMHFEASASDDTSDMDGMPLPPREGVIIHAHLTERARNALVDAADRTGLTRTDVMCQALLVYEAITAVVAKQDALPSEHLLRVEDHESKPWFTIIVRSDTNE